MRVLIAGGGTAGHVSPALALARCLVDVHGAEVRFVGTPSGPEARLVPDAGFPFDAVDARPLRRDVSLETLTAPLAAVRSVSVCRPLVERADVVVGMGGYVSVPVGLAAVRSHRPLVLHEQNAVLGLANRLLARWAQTIALAFAETARVPSRSRTVVTGNPVREQIAKVSKAREALVREALASLGLEPGRKTLAVFGGSQGALHVNTAVVDAIALLGDRVDLQVLLQAGGAHAHQVAEALAESRLPVVVRGFLDRIELAYAIADLVVSRAGANTCTELSACGLPAVLVPYPHATGGHQDANARALERAGAAVRLPDAALSGEVLASLVLDLLDDPARLDSMRERMRSWARPDAAEALAGAVLRAGGRR